MSPRLRTILRTLFITVFAAAAPVLLLYTAGYRYHAQKRRIEKTGIIRVETLPTGAQVSLNGTVQRKTTPAAYSRLLPEDYDVRIEKDGYLPWTDDVDVRSGETAFAVGVRLIKDALPRLTSEGSMSVVAWHDATGRTAFAREGERGTEIVVREMDGKETLAARFAEGTYGAVTLTWSETGDGLLATGTRTDGAKHAFLLRVTDTGISSRALHDSFPRGGVMAHWIPGGDVAVTAASGAYRVTPDGAQSPVAVGRDIVDAVTDGRSWQAIVRGTDGSALARIDDGQRTVLAALPEGEWRFLDGLLSPLIAVDKRRSRIAVLKAGSSTPTIHDASHAERDSAGRTLLLWNDFEISTLDLETDERRTATRVGSTVLGATRLADGRIVFSTPGGIALLEPRTGEFRPAIDLVRFSDIGPFHVTPDGSLLQFAGTVGNMRGLYEREL